MTACGARRITCLHEPPSLRDELKNLTTSWRQLMVRATVRSTRIVFMSGDEWKKISLSQTGAHNNQVVHTEVGPDFAKVVVVVWCSWRFSKLELVAWIVGSRGTTLVEMLTFGVNFRVARHCSRCFACSVELRPTRHLSRRVDSCQYLGRRARHFSRISLLPSPNSFVKLP